MKTLARPCALLLIQAMTLSGHNAQAADAAATEAAKPAFSFSGSATLVNDYVWRGQSQTWGHPALQLGVEVNHRTGLYAGGWASNVSDQWVPGGHVETDVYAGYRSTLPGALAAVNYDFNVLAAYYPGGNFDKTGFAGMKSKRPTGIEASLALNYQWLTLKAGRMLTDFYGWDTNNSPKGVGSFAGDPIDAGVTGDTRGSWFLEANANYEFTPGWSVNGQVGREKIRNADHLDWTYYKAGVTRVIGAWSGSLAWSASNEPDAFKNFLGLTNNGDTYDAMRPRVLLSLTRSF